MSSKEPKKSYKYDLANSLGLLIALSLDHQKYSKWSKWDHVIASCCSCSTFSDAILAISICVDSIDLPPVHAGIRSLRGRTGSAGCLLRAAKSAGDIYVYLQGIIRLTTHSIRLRSKSAQCTTCPGPAYLIRFIIAARPSMRA